MTNQSQTPTTEPAIEAEQYRVYYLGDGQPMLGYSAKYAGDPTWHPLTDPIVMTIDDVMAIAGKVTRRDGRPYSFTPATYSGFPARQITAGSAEYTIAERFFRHLEEIKLALRGGQVPQIKHQLQRRGDVTPTTVDPRARLRAQATVTHAQTSAAEAPQARPQARGRRSVAQQTMG